MISLLIHCTEICFTSVYVVQVSNNGTSFEVTKRKLSYKGIAIFVIKFNNSSCSCFSVLYRVSKNPGVGYL